MWTTTGRILWNTGPHYPTTSSDQISLKRMPTTGHIRKWDPEDMKKAVQAIRNNSMGFLLASKTFRVPKTTLIRMCRSEENITDILSTPLGRKPVLSKEILRKRSSQICQGNGVTILGTY